MRPQSAADMGGHCCGVDSLSGVDVVVDQALVGHAGDLPAPPIRALLRMPQKMTGNSAQVEMLRVSCSALRRGCRSAHPYTVKKAVGCRAWAGIVKF